jgi:hypothetical protein
MKAISAEASRTDVGAVASAFATALRASLASLFRAPVRDQLVGEISTRCKVGDAALRVLDRGEALLDLSIGDFGGVSHAQMVVASGATGQPKASMSRCAIVRSKATLGS